MTEFTKVRTKSEVEKFMTSIPNIKSRSFVMESVNGNITKLETDDQVIKDYLATEGFTVK